MDDTEILRVTGRGSSRETALAHADRIAEQFYGAPWQDVAMRTVGSAEPEVTQADGTVVLFTVEVIYS